MNRKTTILAALALGLALETCAQSPVVLPADYAMPAGSVNTNQPGFTVLPYQTTQGQPGNVTWTLEQLAGLHGPNIADLTGADAQGAFTVGTVVNWSDGGGAVVDGFPSADVFPGITTPPENDNVTEEVLTYIQFPTAGVYTLGVNSDDGFQVTASKLNPRDQFNEVVLGQFNGTRGAGDTLFQVSVAKAGIYPIRLVYWQAGGGASVAFFSQVISGGSTNSILINDSTTPGSLNAFATASVAPPYISKFVHDPTGFIVSISDGVSALNSGSLAIQFNGATVPVVTSKSGGVTTAIFTSPSLIPPGVTNAVSVSYTDNASPVHTNAGSFTFVESPYATLPPANALPPTAVDTTQGGFLYRVSQIDSTANGVLAANIAHAEAQLAGFLPFPNVATSGTQPDGSYIIPDVNFSLDASAEGNFTSANGSADVMFPGISGSSADNIAGEIVGYLDLKPGFYNFGVSSADGFRVASSVNAYDAFGVTLGIYDFRRITAETKFGVAVTQAGLYPIRLVFFSQSLMADNRGTKSLEFYTIAPNGDRTLVNDPAAAGAVKAYWKRLSGYGSFVKYAGPSSFVSPFNGPDVGFDTVNIQLSNGTTNTVNSSSIALSIDGKAVTPTVATASGVTTLSKTYTDTQLPRMVHAAQLIYADQSGAKHTNAWSFNFLKNYVLPAPLSFEDFESTATDSAQGTVPMVPDGWTAENHTGSEMDSSVPANDPSRLDPSNLNSDFYLGWVVVDTSFGPSKDTGISDTAPQTLNGVVLTDESGAEPLLNNHYMRVESDARSNFPSQIDYVYTKSYDLSGKTGVVIAFQSAYEQNQDSMVSLEYSVNGGTNWAPVFYWLQDGYDAQANPDVIRDGLGNVNVNATFLTVYGDVAVFPNASGQYIGGTGYYGSFIRSPITPALAPYVEGRVNDDGKESKRQEIYRVAGADNQKNVQFRFQHDGTSSWYWAIDNWGVYSVPSLVVNTQPPGPLHAASVSGATVISWTGPGTLQSAPDITGPWSNVSGVSGTSYSPSGSDSRLFFRLIE